MSVKHKTLPIGVDKPGFAGVTPSLYAEEHSFLGGAQGSVLVRNTLNSDGSGWIATAAGLFLSTGAATLPSFTSTIPFDLAGQKLTLTGGESNTVGGAAGLKLFGTTNSYAFRIGATLHELNLDYYNGASVSNIFSLSTGGAITATSATLTATSSISASQNSSFQALQLSNSSAGNAADLTLRFDNASANAAWITVYGGSHATKASIFEFNNRSNAAMNFLTNNTLAMSLSASAVMTVSGIGAHTFTGGANSAQKVVVTNTTSGTGAYTALEQNAGTNFGGLFTYSQAYTTSGASMQNATLLYALGSGGLNLQAFDSAGVIRFYTNGANLRWGVNAAGDFTFGSSSHIALSNGTPTCNTNCASVTGTDYAMKVVGSGSNHLSITINFGHTWSTAPICTVLGDAATVPGAPITYGNITTTLLNLTYQANVNTEGLWITCMGY